MRTLKAYSARSGSNLTECALREDIYLYFIPDSHTRYHTGEAALRTCTSFGYSCDLRILPEANPCAMTRVRTCNERLIPQCKPGIGHGINIGEGVL